MDALKTELPGLWHFHTQLVHWSLPWKGLSVAGNVVSHFSEMQLPLPKGFTPELTQFCVKHVYLRWGAGQKIRKFQVTQPFLLQPGKASSEPASCLLRPSSCE